jgi:hypothetical protein
LRKRKTELKRGFVSSARSDPDTDISGRRRHRKPAAALALNKARLYLLSYGT